MTPTTESWAVQVVNRLAWIIQLIGWHAAVLLSHRIHHSDGKNVHVHLRLRYGMSRPLARKSSIRPAWVCINFAFREYSAVGTVVGQKDGVVDAKHH